MTIQNMTDQEIITALQTTSSGGTRTELELEWSRRIMTYKKAQFLPVVQAELGWEDFTVVMDDGVVILREVKNEL